MELSVLPVCQKFLDLRVSLSFPDVQTFRTRHDLHYSTSRQTSVSLASLQSFVGQQLAAMMTSWDTSQTTPHAFAPEAQILHPVCVSTWLCEVYETWLGGPISVPWRAAVLVSIIQLCTYNIIQNVQRSSKCNVKASLNHFRKIHFWRVIQTIFKLEIASTFHAWGFIIRTTRAPGHK